METAQIGGLAGPAVPHWGGATLIGHINWDRQAVGHADRWEQHSIASNIYHNYDTSAALSALPLESSSSLKVPHALRTDRGGLPCRPAL